MHNKKVDQSVVREMNAQGLNDREIARRLGVMRTLVLKVRQRHGIPPALPHNGAKTPDAGRVREMANAGRTDAQIADVLGVSAGTVGELRKRHGIEAGSVVRRRDRPPKPVKVKAPKPSDDALRRGVEEGKTDKEIAAEHGVSFWWVRARRKRAGIKKREAFRPYVLDPVRVAELAAAGKLDHQIAADLGATATAVWNFRKRHGIPAAAPKMVTDAAVSGDFGLPDWVREAERRVLVALLDGPLTRE